MTQIVRTSAATIEDLKPVFGRARLVFLIVCNEDPDPEVLALLDSTRADELILILSAISDKGFMSGAKVTVDVTSDRRFISKRLIDMRGLGAWAKGTLFGIEEDKTKFRKFINEARSFAGVQ